MFRGLEHKAVTWLLIYGLFGVKNHYASSQTPSFCKSSNIMAILDARFQAYFQAKTLEHFEVREVNHDPSLYFSASFCNEPGMPHGYVFHGTFVDNAISPIGGIFALQNERMFYCNIFAHDHTMNKEQPVHGKVGIEIVGVSVP
jgi:hypothetical protein